MTRSLTILTFLAVLPSGAALADDDCVVPLADWQPRSAVVQMAEENDWSVRRIKIDDGCYEIKGTDRDGRRIEVKVDPATLRMIEIEYDDEDDRHVPAEKGHRHDTADEGR